MYYRTPFMYLPRKCKEQEGNLIERRSYMLFLQVGGCFSVFLLIFLFFGCHFWTVSFILLALCDENFGMMGYKLHSDDGDNAVAVSWLRE